MTRLTHLVAIALVALAAGGSACAQAPDVTLRVDWTQPQGAVNRGLFSMQGFMQVYVEPDPMAMQTFTLLNPQDTHTRLEIYIHQMEPENDDADPNVFDWKRFHPQTMIRFIDDRDAFDRFALGTLGMQPLALLCYNAPWLRGDNPNDIVRDHDEWAEFAAAVVESYNGRDAKRAPRLRFVEVWNEPNFANFKIGSMEAYFDLFRTTAARLHRDCPGVLVGGPAISHAPTGDPEAWMTRFLDECGRDADFISWHHYGPQGEPVDRIIDDVRSRVARFRRIPGKQNGKAMITEIDAWFDGWPKIQHMLERQFRLIGVADLLYSVHHFCCLEYNEAGNYEFGIVRPHGAVIEGTFWPYWLFRNYIGDNVAVERAGDRRTSVRACASTYRREGRALSTMVFHNFGASRLRARAELRFAPADHERVLAVDRLAQSHKGVERVERIVAGATTHTVDVALGAGEAVAITLRDAGPRLFAFRDLDSQEQPWIELRPSVDSLGFGETFEATVRVLNTTTRPIDGTIELRGLPDGWTPELIAGASQVKSLEFGREQECRVRVKARSIVPGSRISPYAVLLTGDRADANMTTLDLDRIGHSIPALMHVRAPFEAHALPSPLYAVAGERNEITLQLRSTATRTLDGTLTVELPRGFTAASPPGTFTLPPGERRRVHVPIDIPADARPAKRQGTLHVGFQGADMPLPFAIEIVDAKPPRLAAPLDLSKYLNLDVVAFADNPRDFAADRIGLFAYPGDFTPSDRIARAHGIPFRFASLDDGRKNVVQPQGQVIDVPDDRYTGVAFVGYGHDGKHPGRWTLVYADGSREPIDSQIPEWCTPAPPGFADAFNAPYRYIPTGPASPACQLFMWTVPVDSAKRLRAIELPALDHAYLFAITLLGE